MTQNSDSMKPLSEVAGRIVTTLPNQGTQANTPAPGSTGMAGKTITAAKPVLNYNLGLGAAKSQAIAAQSLVRLVQPTTKLKHVRKVDELGNVEYLTIREVTPADVTESERQEARNAQLPASKEIILSLLAKLAMHKRMTVDTQNQIILFTDFADLLYGVPEYALALAVFELIEKDKGKWFPLVADIRELADSFAVKVEK